MINSEDTWWDLQTVTIKQIMKSDKRIFFMSDDYLTHMKNSEELGFFD